MQKTNSTWSPENIEKVSELLLKHSGKAKQTIYSDIWNFGILTGLGISELLSIRFSDFEQTDGGLVVKSVKLRVGKTSYTRLNPKALEIIERRKLISQDGDFLFESVSNSSKGKPISRISVSRKYQEIGEILGTKLTTNSMRQICMNMAVKTMSATNYFSVYFPDKRS